MTDYRPDPPELPAGYFWDAHRIESTWNREGFPVLDLRKRRLFRRSKFVCRQAMGELLFVSEPYLQDLIIEDAMRKIVERMQL